LSLKIGTGKSFYFLKKCMSHNVPPLCEVPVLRLRQAFCIAAVVGRIFGIKAFID